jgi:hypothetical protein
MSTKSDETEWERIEKNPNNMIVSDILKERLADEYYEEPTNDGPIKVVLSANDMRVVMKLTAVENNQNGWTVIASTTKKNAIRILKQSNEFWDEVKITMGQDDVLREMSLDKKKVSLTISLPDQTIGGLGSDSVVTISHSNE